MYDTKVWFGNKSSTGISSRKEREETTDREGSIIKYNVNVRSVNKDSERIST